MNEIKQYFHWNCGNIMFNNATNNIVYKSHNIIHILAQLIMSRAHTPKEMQLTRKFNGVVGVVYE